LLNPKKRDILVPTRGKKLHDHCNNFLLKQYNSQIQLELFHQELKVFQREGESADKEFYVKY